jgi:hypothetical protein
VATLIDMKMEMLGEPPTEFFLTPMDKDDHPEPGMTPELDIDGIKKHQPLIGAPQWAALIGRCDMAVHVMMLGQCRAAPHKGHLKERLQRICGHVKKCNDAAVRFRAGIPDCSEQDMPVMFHKRGNSLHAVTCKKKHQVTCLSQRINPSV